MDKVIKEAYDSATETGADSDKELMDLLSKRHDLGMLAANTPLNNMMKKLMLLNSPHMTISQ